MTVSIIWDWNGTLLDDVRASYGIFNDMLDARGLGRIGLEQFRALYTHPIIKMYEAVGFEFTDSYSFDDLSTDWYRVYDARFPEVNLFGDALKTLSLISALGWKQMIISALHEETLLRQVELLSVKSHFACVSGHHDLRAEGKLDRARRVAREQGLLPGRTFVIGDTTHDAEMARELGCRCVLVSRGHESKKKLESQGFPVVRDLSEAFAAITAQSPFESS